MERATDTVKSVIKDYGILGVVSFFLSAFYFDTKSYEPMISEMNKNIAVIATEMTGIGRDVTRLEERIIKNEDSDSERDEEIKKLNGGFISLQTRVGFLEERK